MSQPATFGPPTSRPTAGGAHIAVHLVPVLEGAIVAFDVTAPEARGRWLPWDLLDYAGNPYETAAALADDWCGGDITDLRLVDALSFPEQAGSWELALIFRAELGAMPPADDARTPVALPADDPGPIWRFDPVDLTRWAASTRPSAQTRHRPSRDDLLF